MDFEILLDDWFLNISLDGTLEPTANKRVLSIANDFEETHWRFSKFQNFVWDNITETALSHGERQRLISNHQTSLVEAAKKLRLTDKDKDEVGRGSELAEIVLYGIMKHHYGALSVVPKIFYKQNPQDNAKGSDSVHIVVDDKDDFTIWFGEAKFYKSIENARLTSIVDSVEESLKKEKLEKENSIITSVTDLDLLNLKPETLAAIKSLLKNGVSIDHIKPKLHIPILLLHECSITQGCQEMTEDYKNEIIAHHKDRATAYFTKQIGRMSSIHKYSAVTFHIILFPVSSKDTIVEKFLENVEHYKKQ